MHEILTVTADILEVWFTYIYLLISAQYCCHFITECHQTHFDSQSDGALQQSTSSHYVTFLISKLNWKISWWPSEEQSLRTSYSSQPRKSNYRDLSNIFNLIIYSYFLLLNFSILWRFIKLPNFVVCKFLMKGKQITHTLRLSASQHKTWCKVLPPSGLVTQIILFFCKIINLLLASLVNIFLFSVWEILYKNQMINIVRLYLLVELDLLQSTIIITSSLCARGFI